MSERTERADRRWTVYLAGEIHSDWRERIERGVGEAGPPVVFTAPVTDHPASDDRGVAILRYVIRGELG